MPPALLSDRRPLAYVTLKRAIYWGVAPLVCLALYWHGLKAWFQMDDFAWLSLHTQVHDFPSLLSTLFRPMAQGTVRPLSERLFFLGFWNLFGTDALPFRALVFVTQFANLALISAIVRRLTGSSVAGFAAPLLWLVSPVLYLPMTWTSAYNQILCAFFLLAAFFLLLYYIDTKKKLHYAGMWIAFLLGFGALELNVVFPAIACLYTLLFARRYVRAVAPMFVVSIAYALWHRSVGQSLAGDVYAMNFSPQSVLWVAAQYAWVSVSVSPTARLMEATQWPLHLCSAIVLTIVALFIAAMLWRREWLVVFFVGWSVITVAPYLPLAKHMSDYYLTIPAIGLAMLGGWAISLAVHARTGVKAVATVAVLLFAVPCTWQAWTLTRWYSAKSRRVRDMVRGVAAAHALYPTRWIVLHGADDDLFWYGLYDRPEAVFGWPPLYMTADTQPSITLVRDEDISERFLPQSVTLEAIRREQAVVYDVSDGRLRNITGLYVRLRSQSSEAAVLPRFIDAANPLFALFIKQGWYEAAEGYRWTSKRAVLQMGGPSESGASLRVRGRVTELHTATQPLHITLSIDGATIGTQPVPQGTVEFNLLFPLPPELSGKEGMSVAIETDQVVSPASDPRPFGLAMGTVTVVPSRRSVVPLPQ